MSEIKLPKPPAWEAEFVAIREAQKREIIEGFAPKSEPRLCVRWGFGEDRCLKPYDHVGPCEDGAGNTTLTLAEALLAKASGESNQNHVELEEE
jgi:hypothetical protein